MSKKKPDYVIRPLKLMVAPPGKSVFDECVTTVEIEDEAAGEFLQVTQDYESDSHANANTIRLDRDEWPYVREAINRMAKEIDKNGGSK